MAVHEDGKIVVEGNYEPPVFGKLHGAGHQATDTAAEVRRTLVPGGRTHNGTVDHLSRRPTPENQINPNRLAHGKSPSAPLNSARCGPGYELAAKGRMSDSSDSDADGVNHPIRHWQAMESDPHWSAYREDGPITIQFSRPRRRVMPA